MNSNDSVGPSHPMSVQAWIARLNGALHEAERKRPTLERLKRLNRQHNSIREWDLGSGTDATTDPTARNGFRLLP